MRPQDLLKILNQVAQKEITPETALERLRSLPFEDLSFAKVDHHRPLRTGFPEIVWCQGKTIEHTLAICQRLLEKNGHVLCTRVNPEMASALTQNFSPAIYHQLARIVEIGERQKQPENREKFILVVAAGTSDLPVAEEAAVTAEALGSPVERLYDVGVAGLHRLLANCQQLFSANVIIVVAGMEGALASVVGGLAHAPVIAVPTSVGYGSHFGGLAPLLAMLNTCAPGVVTVNIDNGFGAGFFAHLINR